MYASLITMRTVVDTKSILDDRTVLKPKASQHCLLPRESSWPPAAVPMEICRVARPGPVFRRFPG